MLKLKQIIGVLVIAASVLSIPVFTGCKTNEQIAAGGVYSGKANLYNVDNTITTSYDLIHQFVIWEHDNRQTLPVQVTQAADVIRSKAEVAFNTALHARDAYAANANADNKNALDTALALLRSLTTDASNFIASHRTN